MDPRELLRALMKRDGDNPSTLSTKLNHKPQQPQIFKFLQNVSKEPRRSTLKPVADHYGISVDAFYDPDLADRIMDNLQTNRPLMSGISAPKVQTENGVTDLRRKTTLAQLLAGLSEHLIQMNPKTQVIVGDMLKNLASQPEMHADIAAGITAMAPPVAFQPEKRRKG